MIKLEKILDDLGEMKHLEAISPFWEQAITSCSPDDSLPFLDFARIRECREFGGFSSDIDVELEAVAQIVRSNKSLRLMALYIDWRNFECAEREGIVWPELKKPLGEKVSVFWLLMSLAWIPRLQKYHAGLGVEEDVTRETARQIYCYSLFHQMGMGRIGIYSKQYSAFRGYLQDNLFFRIGRFEYVLKPFTNDLIVFRNKVSGRTVALANDGLQVGAEGFIDSLSDNPDTGMEWKTSFNIDDKVATGSLISPLGVITRQVLQLPLSEWDCVLKKNMLVLEMHIPAGGNMDHEKCGESMRRAVDFFKTRFPEKCPAVIVCRLSWMFSPLLDVILKPEANLVKYLRELYLFPVAAGGGTDMLWFLFFQDKFDPASAPRQTSLQRALLDYLEPGRVWHNGGMFIMTEDLKRYGSQQYRKEWENKI